MHYTVLVVDDEQDQRQAIIERVRWADAGFEVVGEAENGVEALDLIEALEPDLILTDIRMPMISQEHLILLLQDHYPTLKTEGAKELAAVYLDLQKKCENAQISSRAMDLRGLLDGVALMEKGLNVQDALDMGITNKTSDSQNSG